MKQYLSLLEDIKKNGEWKLPARNGMPRTKSIFSRELRFNLQEGFPAVTTKKLYWKGVVGELLWFLRGDTNIKYLLENNIHIWDGDAYKFFKHHDNSEETIEEWKELVLKGDFSDLGDAGRIYGDQWRKWSNYDFDQIQYVIDNIKYKPDSRYHIVTAWNPTDFIMYPDLAALPACHMLFQFYVREGKYLDLKLIQRSCDTFLGVPFNIASYGLLIHIIADLTGLYAGEFIWSGNDIHYYENHQEQVDEILTRTPYELPILFRKDNYLNALDSYKENNDLDKFLNSINIEDFELYGYNSYPPLKAPLSVGI